MTTVEPRSLASALRSAGLEPVQVLADGGGDAAAVSGEGVRFAVTVVPAEAPGARALRVRASTLAALHHEHLGRTGPVLDLGDGRWALLRQEVTGVTLTDLRAARGTLTPGEVVTLLVPLAQALAVLHDAGLSHGSVDPGAVVVLPDGRPVLMRACAAPPGEPTVAVTALGDVADLARLGLECLLDPTGGGDPGADPRAASLGALLARTVRGEPRPGTSLTAASLVVDLLAGAAPEPIRLPDPGPAPRRSVVDADPRTPGAPSKGSSPDRSGRRSRHRAGPAGPGIVRRPDRGRGLRAELLGPDVPSVRTRVGLRGPAAVVVLACAAALVWAVAGGSRPPTSLALAQTDPAALALELTAVRAQALAAGDLELLATVSVPGSPAAAADLVTARQVDRLQPARVDLDLMSARVLEETADQVRVVVTSRVAGAGASPQVHDEQAHDEQAHDEQVHGEQAAPAGPPAEGVVGARSVVLVLRPTSEGWAVHEVEEYRP